MNKHLFIYLTVFILFSGCDEPDFVQYFEYTDHNVLNIGSQLTDFIMTNDSNTLIAADKGNNRVLFIDVSTDDMSITESVWVGSEPTSLDLTSNDQYLLVGLQAGSSISVVSMEEKSLLGTINLDEDNVFDVEYVNLTDQLIASYVSSNPAYNKTQIYGWVGNPWDDLEGICSIESICDIAGICDDPSYITQEACETNFTVDGIYNIWTSYNTEELCDSNPAATWIDYNTKGTCLCVPGYCDNESYITQETCEADGAEWHIYDYFTRHLSNTHCYDADGIIETDYETGNTWTTYYTVELESPYSYVNYAGPISISDDEQYIYILDKYNGPPYRVYRYDITSEGLQNKINSSNIADGPVALHDLEYVSGFGVVVAIGGTDFIDNSNLDHSSVYALDDLSHIANLDIGSTPLAITSHEDYVYISPTDIDDNGMFIIEYNIQTQLQTNYYQVAGLLGSHALIIDSNGEYLYAAVDDLSDQDTAEPYNGSSFNIQKIKILSEGTYPINDF